MKKYLDILQHIISSTSNRFFQNLKVIGAPRGMTEVESSIDEPPAAKRACLQVDDKSDEVDAKKDGPQFEKRRKSILLLSYSGVGYMGMQLQRNSEFKTIERDLLRALSKAGAFPPEMETNLGKLQFQRCARTDKGVSAARQVVSIKGLVPVINTHLPPQIRVFELMKVTKSFDSRHNCGGRSYEYVLPTYAFAPYRLTTLDFRIDDNTVALVNKLLGHFVGTHNFHNFTSGKKFEDPSSNRYIISFKSGERFLAKPSCKTCKEVKEMEFIPLRVRGQSFMIHQIRKMVGLMIAIVRGHTPEDTIVRAYQQEKLDIPRAPGLGLLLDNVHFDGYNRKFARDGAREPLEWCKYEEEIEKFKQEHIHQTIVNTEANDMSMMQWLSSLKIHDFHSTFRRLQTDDSEQPKTQSVDVDKTKTSSAAENEEESSTDAKHDSPTAQQISSSVDSVATGTREIADTATLVATSDSRNEGYSEQDGTKESL